MLLATMPLLLLLRRWPLLWCEALAGGRREGPGVAGLRRVGWAMAGDASWHVVDGLLRSLALSLSLSLCL